MNCRALVAIGVVAATACGTATRGAELSAAPEAAAEFAIQLHRPVQIGEQAKQHITATFDHSLRTFSGQTMLSEQINKVAIAFVADTKVIDVDAVGIATKTELAVESCTVDSGAGPMPLFSPGVVLTVTRGGDPAIVSQNGTLPRATAQWLRMVLPTGPATMTDDDIFGSTAPRVVGAVWPVNADFMANELGAVGLRIRPDRIIGQATLAAVDVVAGRQALDIRVEVSATGVEPDQKPADAVVERGELHTELTSWYPVDPSHMRLKDSATATVELVLVHPATSVSKDAKPGETLRTEIIARQHRESTYAAVSPES